MQHYRAQNKHISILLKNGIINFLRFLYGIRQLYMLQTEVCHVISENCLPKVDQNGLFLNQNWTQAL